MDELAAVRRSRRAPLLAPALLLWLAAGCRDGSSNGDGTSPAPPVPPPPIDDLGPWPPADPAVFQNLAVEAVRDTSVVIRWASASPRTSRIEYGPGSEIAASTDEERLGYYFRHVLSSLSPGTTYRFRVKTRTYPGDPSMSTDFSFTTRTTAELDQVIRDARQDGGLPRTVVVGPSDSPSAAVAQADVGDTVLLADATWTGEHIVFARSGIDVAPITLAAAAGSPTLDGQNSSGTGIEIEGHSHVVVRDLTLRRYDYAIHVIGPSSVDVSDIEIASNRVDTSNSAIRFTNVGSISFRDVRVEQNTIADLTTTNYHAAIAPQGMSGAYIRNNALARCRNGVLSNQLADHLRIDGNTFDNVYYRTITFAPSCANIGVTENSIAETTGPDGRSIRFDYNCSELLVFRNMLTNAGAGIQMYPGIMNVVIAENTFDNSGVRTYGSNSLIEKNLFVNLPQDGMNVWLEGTVDRPLRNLIFRKNVMRNASHVEIGGNTEQIAIENNVFANFAGKPGMIFLGYLTGPRTGLSIRNNTFFTTAGGMDAINFTTGGPIDQVDIRNNIFANLGGSAAYSQNGTNVVAAHNVVWNVASPPFVGASAMNTLVADPLLADPVGGDFHLKSVAGRWNGTAWVLDGATSPCVDAGDPASPFDLEPTPNGGRINLGAYGNTAEASKSP